MSIGRVWAAAVVCVVAGISLLALADGVEQSGSLVRVAGFALMIVPVGLAANVTARRRRARRREDSPDSVEFQAAQVARSAAFEDGLVLACLTMLALAVRPGPLPMLWAVRLILALIASFGVRYALALGRIRG